MHGIIQLEARSLAHPSRWVYPIVIFFSLLLSYIAMRRAVVINPDAICYIQSAASMKLGLATASHLCGQAKWPFFSICIFAVANALKLSYLQAAYLLDGVFSCISVLAFIHIVRFIKDTPRLMWLSAFVILLAHQFNAVREYVIRDHGFWAFYLLSILLLLHFFQKPQWRYALAWSGSILLATLFRVEGIFFLVFMPWICFFVGEKKIVSFFKLNAVTVAVLFVLGIWIFSHVGQETQNFGRLGEVKFQLMHGVNAIAEKFQNNSNILATQILSQFSKHEANFVFVLVLMQWYFLSVVLNLSIIYAALVLYAWKKNLLQARTSIRWVIWGYVVVNMLVTSTFLLENMFLSKRYLLALSLTLMIWVPFALDKIIEQHRKILTVMVMTMIVVFSLGGIFDFGYSKQYIRDAGMWLAENAPQDAAIYSNDYFVMFYSQHFGNTIFSKRQEFSEPNALAKDKWRNYDYIAIRTNKHKSLRNDVALNELGEPIKVFLNKRGDEVVIWKGR